MSKKNKLALFKEATQDNLNKLSKPELIKLINQSIMPITEPEKYKEMVKKALPEFVKEMDTKESLGTSVMEANQEMMLVIADCLRRYHNFKDSDITSLHNEITDVLLGVKEYEDSGLSMLTPHTIRQVGDQVEMIGPEHLVAEIAKIRSKKNMMLISGQDYQAITLGEIPLKKLQAKNDKKK